MPQLLGATREVTLARRGTEEAGDAPATKGPSNLGRTGSSQRVPEDPLKVQEEGIDERRDLPERRTKGVVSAEIA